MKIGYNSVGFLFKRTINNVDGFNEGLDDSIEYVLSKTDKMTDDAEVTYTDVQQEDVISLSYNTYKLIGPVTEDELAVLNKFKILSK